jgi:prevent-host-death family protein
MSLTDARSKLLDVANRFENTTDPTPIKVTKHSKPVMVLVPAETYESMVETLEILADEETMASLRRGLADAEAGRTIPWEEAKRRLGL